MKPLSLLAFITLFVVHSLSAQIYIPDATLTLTGSVTVVETDERAAFNASPGGSGTPQTEGRINLALATNGSSAFESSNIDPTYGDDKLNNGVYGAGQTPNNNDSTRSWISHHTETNGWGGVKFAAPSTLDRIGFGSRFNSRADGDFTLQYTTSDFTGVDLEVPAHVDALTWVNIGTLTSTTSGEFGRHLFALTTPVENVTGVRIIVEQAGSSITEIEAYSFGTRIVTTLADSGPGSLRDTIAAASSGDTITFAPALSGQTITLGGTELIITKNLTLDASALPDGITVSGNDASRVFRILVGTVVMDSVSVTGGRVSGHGAGINSNSANLTFRNGTISGNTADGAHSYGGGIFNFAGTLTVENSTISGNDADSSGGIDNSSASASATLTNVTITGNTVRSVGGGVANADDASLTLIHCTISGNSANDVLNGRGGGIFFGNGTLAIENSIIAGNTASAGEPDIIKYGGTITATGNNLIGDNSTVATEFPAPASPGTANTNGDYVGTSASPLDPLLGDLGNYGGPTQTMYPLYNWPVSVSDAIGSAATLPSSPATDQRGLSRAVSAPDIGAVETGNVIPGFTPVVTSNGDTFDGLDQNGVSLREAIALASSGATVTFDAALSGNTITLGGTELSITQNLTLDASALPEGITVSGNDASRVFQITIAPTVVMDSVSVTGGRVSDNGAGIHNLEGTLTFRNGTISGNTADGVNSGGGGILNYHGTLTMENSTISGNVAAYGGGIRNSLTSTSATLTNVTITGNTARELGGGVFNSHNASLTLIHCTISGNATTNNIGGGGISISSAGLPPTLDIENSIVAGNTGGSGAPDIDKDGGTITATGRNLIGDNSTVETEFPAPANPSIIANVNGDFVGTSASPFDPLLAPLGNYGSSTLTLRPLPTSFAIDYAATLGTTPATDQRGVSRPQGAASDIGAFEVLAPAGFVDTDSDGMDDRLEPLYGFTVGVQDGHLDADYDGSSNAAELGNVTDPLDSSNLLRIMSMAPVAGFHPITNPLFKITINTFPGLSYRLESSNTLTSFADIPGSEFTATGFSQELLVTLGANGDFVRAQRD